MIRRVVVFAMVAATGCSSQESALKSVPEFQFRSISLSTDQAHASAAGTVSNCYSHAHGSSCKLAGRPIAGSYWSDGKVDFEHGKFVALEATFDPEQLGRVEANLRAAYGEPCADEIGTADTSAGVARINRRVFWCFVEGRLALEQFAYGAMLNKSLVEFPYGSRDAATAKSPNDL